MNTISQQTLDRLDIREIIIRAEDDYALHGTHFAPERPRAAVLLSAGTGIPQYFYHNFAMWLADQGYAVLTYDYRGIGMSKPDKMSSLYGTTKQDWARLDMSAALQRLRHEHPGVPLVLLGHSLGGQLMGLIRGIEHVEAIITYGSGFGYWGAMPAPQKYRVFALWYVGIPLLSKSLRYFPAQALGLGEDLPAGAAMEWARWGKRRRYFTRDFRTHPGFQNLSVPWLALQATDDDITTDANARGLHECYPNAQLTTQLIDPADFGYNDIGHLKFFSSKRRQAWRVVTDWLAQHTKAPHQATDA